MGKTKEIRDIKDAISTAAEQLSGSDCFVLIAVKKGKIDSTIFINNAGAALGILHNMKQIEAGILQSPSSSG